MHLQLTIFFKGYYICIFREKGREGERDREKHPSVASHTCPTEDRTHNLGMGPDQELNQQLFTLWDNSQPTESHWPGLGL